MSTSWEGRTRGPGPTDQDLGRRREHEQLDQHAPSLHGDRTVAHTVHVGGRICHHHERRHQQTEDPPVVDREPSAERPGRGASHSGSRPAARPERPCSAAGYRVPRSGAERVSRSPRTTRTTASPATPTMANRARRVRASGTWWKAPNWTSDVLYTACQPVKLDPPASRRRHLADRTHAVGQGEREEEPDEGHSQGLRHRSPPSEHHGDQDQREDDRFQQQGQSQHHRPGSPPPITPSDEHECAREHQKHAGVVQPQDRSDQVTPQQQAGQHRARPEAASLLAGGRP